MVESIPQLSCHQPRLSCFLLFLFSKLQARTTTGDITSHFFEYLSILVS